MSWTDERVELLRKLWSDGLSAGHIAAEIGGLTRNAVIGKVHRLGLAAHARPTNPKHRRPRRARPARMLFKPRVVADIEPVFVEEAIPLEPVLDSMIPMGQRRSLLELTSETCHWPIGDPSTTDFFFCGGAAMACDPYCAGHHALAYQPAGQSRRPYIPRGMVA